MGSVFNYLWHGPPGLTRSLKLEWRLVAIRWVGAAVALPGLALVGLSPERLLAAYAIVGIAIVYNFVIQRLIRERPALIEPGYVTAVCDAVLHASMMWVASFDSPLYFILFAITMTTAMRYGYGPSFAMASMFVLFDTLESAIQRQPPSGAFFFRSGFLLITAVLASYLKEQADRAEAALEQRLRQANRFNEATGMLIASLDSETVLKSVVAAASHLFGSRFGVFQPSTRLSDQTAGGQGVVYHPLSARSLVHSELAALCGRYTSGSAWRQGTGPASETHTLGSGHEAIVLVLALPAWQTALGTLALAAPPGEKLPSLDSDVLEPFIERITLAIENASLYRTLASRSDDLQRAYADLASAHQELLSVDEMKTTFLANVSHELRTPLSSIRAFSELLLSYDDPATRQEFVEIINAESERLTRLVNDVLDITKIEAGRMDWNMDKLDTPALLEAVARTYAKLIEQHNLAFELEIAPDLPAVYGDRDRLQQLVGNLLNNAVKFTQEGSIRLTARRAGEELHVSVADTGVGIPPEDRERIFDKFQQLGALLTDKPGGTGLGLAICREIIEHHQGRIWVESERGKGSCFTFVLPASHVAQVPIEQPAEVA